MSRPNFSEKNLPEYALTNFCHFGNFALNKMDDISSLLKYAGNIKIAENVLSIAHPYNEPNAAFLHSNNVAQLAYWRGEPFWNKGIASEAVGAVIKYGMETLQMSSIFAECREDNRSSKKVMIKSGIELAGSNRGVVQYQVKKQVL
jgi:hypothetical protein